MLKLPNHHLRSTVFNFIRKNFNDLLLIRRREREGEKKKPECRQEKTGLTNGVSAPPTILMLSWSSSPLWISIVDTSPSDTGFFPATMIVIIIINILLMLPSLDFYR